MTPKSNPIIAWFAGHPTAANLLMLIFLFMGVLSVTNLQRETFPEFTPNEVRVSVAYPGATAEDVEEAICQRIEDALDAISNVEEVRSDARENLGQVTVEMVEGADPITFFNDIKTEVDAIDNFPEQAEDPVVTELNRTELVCAVAVAGPMTPADLKVYCEDVKDRMRRLPEISEVELTGFSDRQIRIEVPVQNLMQLSMSVSDLADRIARQSVDLPSGTIETRDADVLIRFSDLRRTVAEYEDLIVISGNSGAEVRLGDIATITDTFELEEDKVIFNGQRAGVLNIKKTQDQDALTIMDAVQAFLERERQTAPPTVKYVITRNISKIVRDRLQMLVVNGLQGLLLVFLTMWLFFTFRFSFWVAMGLPVSFMAGFFFMDALGFSLNMLSLVGLLLAIGLLMDDAIVISENMAAHLKQGKSPLQAAVDGASEVAGGVLSSFITTVCIFGSIAFYITGNIGKVLWVMPVVLIITLSVSLVEAFLILPNHLSHALHGMENKGRFRLWFEDRFESFRKNVVGRLASLAVSWRYLLIGLVLAAFATSLGLLAGGVLKMRAFPDIEGDVLEARLLLPQGAPLQRTEETVASITEALGRVNDHYKPMQPKKQDLVQNVNIRFSENADAYETGPHVATITADLLSAETRNAPMDDIQNLWREETGQLPDVISLTFKEPAMGPAGLPIDIRLMGDDLAQLKAASGELIDWLDDYKGVFDLNDDLRPGKPEILVQLKPGALSLGLDAASIARQLRAAFWGQEADEIQAGSESFEIDVRLAKEDQDSLADLDHMRIVTPSGEQAPLSSVANLTEGRGWSRIARVDGVRTVTIRGDMDARVANSGEIIADTQKRFLPQLAQQYPGVTFGLEGESAEGAKTGQSLLKAFAVGIFGIFVLLSFQFRSYLEPFVVIAAIPLAFIGVIWGHALLGYDLSMPSIMGFVSLAGVVVNDSILLVLFIKKGVAQGLSIPQAAAQASPQRFRAVLLTSLTTIMGLIPLLLERSLQAQVLIPLAVSLVFGLTTATLLVLFVIPAFYAILGDMGLTKTPLAADYPE